MICSQSQTTLFVLCLALFCFFTAGCGGSANKVTYGTVSCGGEKPTDGYICFVPIEGQTGPTSSALIVAGEYRIEDRGGVAPGKYRVEVRAKKKTGRQVASFRTPSERVMADEVIPLSPVAYEGKESPLVVEVASGGDGRIDIEIPGRKK